MGKTALVVEDTPANKDFFDRLLQQAGFEVVSVSSGKAALEAVASRVELSLAVIDMEMPDMSGLHLTKQLRHKFPDLFAVVATMHDQRSLMESAFDKGCNLFLVKPHGFMELFQLLTQNELCVLRERPSHVLDQYGLRQFAAT